VRYSWTADGLPDSAGPPFANAWPDRLAPIRPLTKTEGGVGCALFLEAAGDGPWSLYLSDDLPAELVEVDPWFTDRMSAMMDYTASRTRFFDEFFVTAAGEGVTQAVILAAGLDARAWRSDWPAGAAVYEIDQPKVLAFKTSTLPSHGVVPVAADVAVGIDLRQDWPAALRVAGFNSNLPTAWSAEAFTNDFSAPKASRASNFRLIPSLPLRGA
jgi:methyltransferase (TIGR00027 family)